MLQIQNRRRRRCKGAMLSHPLPMLSHSRPTLDQVAARHSGTESIRSGLNCWDRLDRLGLFLEELERSRISCCIFRIS
jgi:hypothetical protein